MVNKYGMSDRFETAAVWCCMALGFGSFFGIVFGMFFFAMKDRVFIAIEEGDHFYLRDIRYRCAKEKP